MTTTSSTIQTGPHKDALLRKVISQGLPKMNHHQQYIFNQYCAQDGQVSFVVNETEFPRNVGLSLTINSIAIAEWLINDGLDIVVLSDRMNIGYSNFSYAVQKFANQIRISHTKSRCATYSNYTYNGPQDILRKGSNSVRVVPSSSDHRGSRNVDLLIYERHRNNSQISNKIRDAIEYNYRPKRIITTLPR